VGGDGEERKRLVLLLLLAGFFKEAFKGPFKGLFKGLFKGPFVWNWKADAG